MDNLPLDSKFVHWIQPYDQNVVANLIDSNAMLTSSHVKLNPVYDLTPRVADMLSSTIHQWNYTFDSIGAFLRQQNKVATIDIDEKEVKWKLAGKGHFHARVVENLNENIEFVGVGGSEFELKLDVDWWDEMDVLAPVAGIYRINAQVRSKYQDGLSTVYRLQLIDMADDAFLEQEYLEAGMEWVKLFSSSGEASSARGSFVATGEAPTYVELRNKLTHLNMKVKVTDEAVKKSKIILSQELKYARKIGDKQYAPNPDHPMFLDNSAEQKFIMEARKQEQYALLFSRHNGNKAIDPSSGYVIDQGAGLFEFLQTGNRMEHPVTSYAIDMLIDAIKQRWYNRVQYGDRNIVIWTGEGGLDLAQQFFERKRLESGASLTYTDITTGGAVTFGPGYEGRKFRTSYITEYQMFPWGSIKFAHLPLLDDLTLNSGGPTYRGRPYSSYYFLVMDTGLGTGPASNLQLIKRKGMTNYSYVCGLWSPAGPLNNMSNIKGTTWVNGAHPGNFYELHYDDWTGIVMKDASLSLFSVPALSTV